MTYYLALATADGKEISGDRYERQQYVPGQDMIWVEPGFTGVVSMFLIYKNMKVKGTPIRTGYIEPHIRMGQGITARLSQIRNVT